MKITHDEAAEMYARACRAWYGPRAKGIVHKKIKQLERRLHSNFHECLPPTLKATVDHENAPRKEDAGQVTDQESPMRGLPSIPQFGC